MAEVKPAADVAGSTGRRVYLVDDEVEQRESLQLLLHSSGYDAHSVADPYDLLATAGHIPPGVILLDVRMPSIDGLTFLDKLRPHSSRFAVVMMTGHGDIEMAVSAFHKGAKDFLEKPLRADVLNSVIDRELVALAGRLERGSAERDAAATIARLSKRERQVLELIVAGMSNKVIGWKLEISGRTAEMHRARMMQKLGCKNLADAISLYHLAQTVVSRDL